MTTTDLISADLKTVLRRLKLSPMLHTLPERLTLARHQNMTHQDFFLLVLDSMDAIESRDVYEITTERHRSGSMIFTSNRGPDEWLATFSDALLAQSAIDRFRSDASMPPYFDFHL